MIRYPRGAVKASAAREGVLGLGGAGQLECAVVAPVGSDGAPAGGRGALGEETGCEFDST